MRGLGELGHGCFYGETREGSKINRYQRRDSDKVKKGAVQIGKWRACQEERTVQYKGPEASEMLSVFKE